MLLAEQLQKFIKDNEISVQNILGIGLGILGTLDPSSRMLISAPHMPGWVRMVLSVAITKDV
jgi:hypothetical protein